MKNETYKPNTREFLGVEVVTVIDGTKEYMTIQSFFGALDLLREDGQVHAGRRKELYDFLEGIGQITYGKTFAISTNSRKKNAPKSRKVDCILIDVVPTCATQFKPSKRRGKKALQKWFEFMKLVNRILEENELYKVVITSKDIYKENAKLIADCTDKTIPIAIRQVKMAMAELLQVTPEIKMIAKDELKIYQPKISIDLVEVYDELLQVFVQNLVITQSYKQARENSVLFLKKKYRLEDISQAK